MPLLIEKIVVSSTNVANGVLLVLGMYTVKMSERSCHYLEGCQLTCHTVGTSA